MTGCRMNTVVGMRFFIVAVREGENVNNSPDVVHLLQLEYLKLLPPVCRHQMPLLECEHSVHSNHPAMHQILPRFFLYGILTTRVLLAVDFHR